MAKLSARSVGVQHVEPLLVDVKRLAKMLSCSVRSVWRLNASGKTPSPVRVGRSVRWSMDTIRTWIGMGCPDRATFETRLRGKQGGQEKHVA